MWQIVWGELLHDSPAPRGSSNDFSRGATAVNRLLSMGAFHLLDHSFLLLQRQGHRLEKFFLFSSLFSYFSFSLWLNFGGKELRRLAENHPPRGTAIPTTTRREWEADSARSFIILISYLRFTTDSKHGGKGNPLATTLQNPWLQEASDRQFTINYLFLFSFP